MKKEKIHISRLYVSHSFVSKIFIIILSDTAVEKD